MIQHYVTKIAFRSCVCLFVCLFVYSSILLDECRITSCATIATSSCIIYVKQLAGPKIAFMFSVCVCVCVCSSANITCAKLRHSLLCHYSHERSGSY